MCVPTVYMATIAALTMNKNISVAKRFREQCSSRSKAVGTIQRAYRAIIKRRGQLNLSLVALGVFKRKVFCFSLEFVLNWSVDVFSLSYGICKGFVLSLSHLSSRACSSSWQHVPCVCVVQCVVA